MSIRLYYRIVAGVVLLCHFMVTFGLPSPTSLFAIRVESGQPYPCQHRRCGCLSAERCWQGDCCCFKLEEKLEWAGANGVEPPKHVRPMVALRRAVAPAAVNSFGSAPREKTCDSLKSHSCCEKAQNKPVALADGSECGSVRQVKTYGPKTTPEPSPGVQWILGAFAQKCRGETAAGVFLLDFAMVLDHSPVLLVKPASVGLITLATERILSISDIPPLPPPRQA